MDAMLNSLSKPKYFSSVSIEQTVVSLHGLREQSKCSKGFRSNKKVEKHWCIVNIFRG